MSGFVLSEATASALELPQLRALVRLHAASDLGREELDGLRPFEDEEKLLERRRLLAETAELLPLVPSQERDLGPVLGSLGGHGGDLDGADVVLVGDLLAIGAEAARRVGERDPAPPLLAALVEAPPLDELRRRIERVFDRRGRIRPDASPRLVELRSRARGARDRLYRDLQRVLAEHSEEFSEDTVPMRGGRLVVVLKSGSKGRLPGLVHGRSGTGKSFYFEPLEAVETNNELAEALEEEEEEKRRLLVETLDQIRRQLPAVRRWARIVAALDALQAICRFGELVEGRAAELAPPGELRLVGARHPLLDPRLAESRREALGHAGHEGEVVPLDLELDAGTRMLVVTGPNAGGKTVALKTLGLLALAHQCGLPIPVGEGSRLPSLRGVVATVGDDQDLLADRSTFSGRLLRLQEAWEAAGPGVLALLDELGSGTDPEEGSALSIALVEELLRRGGTTLVTTHLVAVAAAAMELDGAACAAMAFDAASGAPTFRLEPGPPGGSEALALARRLGLSEGWTRRAEELLGPEHRDLRRLLREVEEVRDELAAERARLETERRDAETLRRRLAAEEKALVEERRGLEADLRAQLRDFRAEVRQRLRDETERIRAELEAGRRRGLEAEATERVFADAPLDPRPPAPDAEREPEVGDRVRHRVLGWAGTLRRLDRGRAEVETGGKALRCRIGELVLVEAGAAGGSSGAPGPGAAKGLPPGAARRPAVEAPEADDVPRELELVGQRVEPALRELDRHLDRALLASRDEVRVVHGHGSGRLRSAVRSHLRGHPAVASSRAGASDEGGDAVTIVRLRGA